jgi:ribonuclease HI
VENGLAVGSELKHRRIKDGITCLVCGKEESLTHRFWSCSHSRAAWSLLEENTGFAFEMPPKLIRGHSDLRAWVLDWLGKAKGKSVSLTMMLIYKLWLARNDAREKERIDNPEDIVKNSIAGVEEWMSIHERKVNPRSKVTEHWLSPEVGWYKVNVDGAFRAAEKYGGGGVVIRDCHGSFLAGAHHFPPHIADAEGAKLMACRVGLQLANQEHCRNVVLETDSTEVAAKLDREGHDRSTYGPLVSEIKSLFLGFEAVRVRSVRRSANDVAHRMAQEGCVTRSSRVWRGVAPDFVLNRVVMDSVLV